MRSEAMAIAALWTEAYVTDGVGGRAEPYGKEDFLVADRDGEVFVCDGEGGLAGVVVLYPPGAPGRAVARAGEAELSRLAVTRPARGRGLGRALAAFCTDCARERGWDSIVLWSRAAQVEAHRLYESLGYRRLPERDSVDGSGLARLVFRMRL
ncbi:MAG TPA: GNAT family N-acetyltransferase [Solirubrobacterales bacterium]|nr:GNAT family N-acetyltransferase [Solirubrobacterales bacterium]